MTSSEGNRRRWNPKNGEIVVSPHAIDPSDLTRGTADDEPLSQAEVEAIGNFALAPEDLSVDEFVALVSACEAAAGLDPEDPNVSHYRIVLPSMHDSADRR